MPNNTMFQFFYWMLPENKCLWQHAASEASKLKNLGITGIWLPPAYKSAAGNSMGYDAYDLFDLGEFDQKGSVPTRFGNRDEYIAAIHALHEQGIQVYADIVLNHKAGADETEEVLAHEVNPDNRNEIISKDYKIKAFTKFTFPGRGKKYSDFIWDYHCFTGVDWDENKKKKGVFKLINEYGTTWEDLFSEEKGNFDYLMFSDIEFRNPAVREELKKWALWYLKTTGVDGFRLDAVKHISISFFPDWLHHIREQTQKELFAVGEFADEVNFMTKYLEYSQHCMSLFDFALQKNFHEASNAGESYDLRQIFDQTLTSHDPIHSVTFVENHDTQASRLANLDVKAWFRPHAYALILLRSAGYPCVFYPDLYGIEISKKDENGNESLEKHPPCESLEILLNARKNLAYGEQTDYFESPSLIGWVRTGTQDSNTGLAALLSTKEDGSLEMEMGQQYAGKTFTEITASISDKIKINADGKATFSVKAGKIAVWVPE